MNIAALCIFQISRISSIKPKRIICRQPAANLPPIYSLFLLYPPKMYCTIFSSVHYHAVFSSSTYSYELLVKARAFLIGLHPYTIHIFALSSPIACPHCSPGVHRKCLGYLIRSVFNIPCASQPLKIIHYLTCQYSLLTCHYRLLTCTLYSLTTNFGIIVMEVVSGDIALFLCIGVR